MRNFPQIKPSFGIKVPISIKKTKRNTKNRRHFSQRNRPNILSTQTKPLTIPFNAIQTPIVTDVLGSALIKPQDLPEDQTSKYLYKRRKLYGMSNSQRSSIESLNRNPKTFRANPVFWTKEKRNLQTHRKIDTKGIGLRIYPRNSLGCKLPSNMKSQWD